MTRSYSVSALALALAVLSSCTGGAPNTGVGERLGAKGRIVGYFYDVETGAPMVDVRVTTRQLGVEVVVQSVDGFFVLDNLTAGGTYRVTMTKDGFVPRWANVTIGQVPQDAYDAVAVANVGSLPMSKPVGVLNGRVEFLTNGPVPVPVPGASVVVDLVNNGNHLLTKTVVTSATGTFSVDGLPNAPTGFSVSVCVVPALGSTGQLEFSPTCTNATVYTGIANYVVIRPSLVDQNNGDINIVQGVVRDAFTRLPQSGVEVFESGGTTAIATTDANGYYFLRSAQVNRFAWYTYRKAGYAEGYTEFNFGRGGTNTRDINLALGGASVTGKITYANLQPANNAEVRVDLRTTGAGYNVFRNVRTNATGDFTIDQLPGLPDGLGVTLFVTPWTADPDLYPETGPQSFGVTLFPGAATPVYRQLTSVAGLSIVANNAFSGTVGVNEPISLFVSLPTVPADNGYTLIDTNTNAAMPFTVAYADGDKRITITPLVATGQPLWSENRGYNLNVRLKANNGPSGLLNTNIGFNARTSMTGAAITGRITSLVVDNPDVDSTSRQHTFRWPPLPDAFGYALYARTANTSRVPSYTRIALQTTTSPTPNAAVNLGALPGSLSNALEAAAGQPFAFGQIISFLVVPIDARGIETDATKGATLDLRDVVPPRFEAGIAQLDNGAGGSSVRFVVRATEPLDRTTPPTFVAPSGLSMMGWSVDETTGGIEGTLRLAGSASSGTLSVQLRDTSGNLGRALAVPVVATALIPSFGFEGSATSCSTTGWTADSNTNCAACPTQQHTNAANASVALPGTTSAYSGVCALALGDPDQLSCGVQGISTAFDLSTAVYDRRSLTLQARFWPYQAQGSGTASVQLLDTGNTVLVSPFNFSSANTQRTWVQLGNDISSYIGSAARLRVQFTTSSTCNSRSGMQVDDLRVFVK